MTHYIPIGAPEFRGVAMANCGARVPVKLHDSEPTCPTCSNVEADLERGMREPAARPALAEEFPEPDEEFPEPDKPMEPISALAGRIIGFRQVVKSPPPDPPAAVPEPGPGEFLTTSLEKATATLSLVGQSKDIIALADALQVTDAASWHQGIDYFDLLRSFETGIDAHYRPHIKRAHEAWNGLTTELRTLMQPINQARSNLGDRCATWRAAENQREKAEQQRLERLAREEQQLAATRAAVQAERAGEPETAKQILEEAKTAPLPIVAHQSTVPTSTKATTPMRWMCNVTDLPALLKAIGEGQFPEFHAPILEALQPLLNAQAKTLKGELGKRYPGTEGRQKPSTAGRG